MKSDPSDPTRESSWDDDNRPQCADCREPVELADPADPESWIHAIDANYWGDHTAWVKPNEGPSEIQQESSS